ncbi:MAG: hypothetical protein EB084_08935 [Proteobacteria bacterium]|nr:hypothetical protein [Pseudomonadota bacterium]
MASRLKGMAARLGYVLAAAAVGAPWFGCVAAAQTSCRSGDGWTWTCRGNAADANVTPRPGLLLAGGGEDVDAAFRWLAEHASGGDVVVLRASGGDAYNEYIDGLGKVDSVETLVITRPRAARDPFVVDRVRKADAIFVAGGDQWDYVRMWKDTPLGDAIQARVDAGVPVGGTSAGLAILGEHVFTAAHDTVDSKTALADPHDRHVTLEHHFLRLPYMKDVITDTHFMARDRMGRLLTFMSRTMEDGASRVRGIAVEEGAAVLVEGDGAARVVGTGPAWFLQARPQPRDDFKAAPLEVHDVAVERVATGGTFDLTTWSGTTPTYRLDVDAGRLRSSRPDGGVY